MPLDRSAMGILGRASLLESPFPERACLSVGVTVPRSGV